MAPPRSLGTSPRPRPLGDEIQVLRAVGGEEPSHAERGRIRELVERHRTQPLELPADVGGVRDWVIAVEAEGWAPPHRSTASKSGYPTREAALARIEQMRSSYAKRRVTAPPMRAVPRMRRLPVGG